MRHHTKDKGDIGLGHVIAAFLAGGVQVALPISEHLAFDLIAIGPDDVLKRVSVKYRAVNSRGHIYVPLRSVWADRHGTHTTDHVGSEYDDLAIYCPDTQSCYFIRMDEVAPKSLCLRPAGAEAYTDPLRIFQAPVAQLD